MTERTAFQQAMASAMNDYREAMVAELERPFWFGQQYVKPWPWFVLFPRVEQARVWLSTRRTRFRNFLERVGDAWDVLRGRYYE